MNFEKVITISFNLLLVCPSVRKFVFAVLFIPSFNVLSNYFCFTQFGGSFYCQNFDHEIRDTAPLIISGIKIGYLSLLQQCFGC